MMLNRVWVLLITTMVLVLWTTDFSYAQYTGPKLYPGRVDWLADHHFPIEDYKWNIKPVNELVYLAIDKRDLGFLGRATSLAMDTLIGKTYEGTEIFRRPANARWLRRQNIQINYYDGSVPEANRALIHVMETRHVQNFTDVVGITTISIGGAIFLSNLIGALLTPIGCLMGPCDAYIEGRNQGMNTGLIIVTSGIATFSLGRLISGGSYKKGLRRFSKAWYRSLRLRGAFKSG